MIRDLLLLLLLFIFLFFKLFIYFWLHWVFIAFCTGFRQLGPAGAALPCGAQASRCRGFSGCGAQAVGAHGLRSWGSQAWSSCSMWNLPRPGPETTSPALTSGLLTSGPPAKSTLTYFSLMVKSLPSKEPLNLFYHCHLS